MTGGVSGDVSADLTGDLTGDVSGDVSTGPHAGIVIVLMRTEGPLNLGSVARLCGNFGAELRLVDVRADASCREAIMMAHPSEGLLERAPRFATLAEAAARPETRAYE